MSNHPKMQDKYINYSLFILLLNLKQIFIYILQVIKIQISFFGLISIYSL